MFKLFFLTTSVALNCCLALMRVVPVPVLSDNYAYLLIDENSKEAIAIDPAEPSKLISKANDVGVSITKVLTTHKHFDHAGGNNEIKRLIKGIQVVGGKYDEVEGCDVRVEDNEIIHFHDITIKCLHTPGHTMGHICYFAESSPSEPSLFTGDCLFIGGAGKFFEGTGVEMFDSLYNKISRLPDNTLIYCGHEYTLQNYKFARHIEPDNPDLEEAEKSAISKLNDGKFTIPSTIDIEKRTNPFMRAHIDSIKKAVGLAASAKTEESLQSIRDSKNSFR